MADKRTVDDVSIKELERILATKRRETHQRGLQRLRSNGRVIETIENKSQPIQLQRQQSESSLVSETVKIKQESIQTYKVTPEVRNTNSHSYRMRFNLEHFQRSFLNHLLLVLEIGVVISLIILGVALFNGLNFLEEETASVQSISEAQRFASLPTVAPTPQLTLDRVVLPTGHTFQNDEPIFNFSEIPENMRGLVANQIYLSPDITRVNVTDDTPLRVIIPDINIDNTIVQGVDWSALQQGIGMLPNGAIPTSETDNVVLAAHNDIYGELFRNLDQLENGDELQVQTQSGFFTYIVSDTLIVDPSDVYVMESQGTPMVTLISCYPYNVNNRRIIVQAERVNL